MTRPELLARLVGVIALTLSTSTLVACATWGTSAPVSAGSARPLETTVVNNHGHAITAIVSVFGTELRLGTVEKGEQRTFELPPAVAPSSTYYLVGDCSTGARVVSDRIRAVAARRPHFMVGQNSLTSYVRFLRTPWITGAH